MLEKNNIATAASSCTLWDIDPIVVYMKNRLRVQLVSLNNPSIVSHTHPQTHSMSQAGSWRGSSCDDEVWISVETELALCGGGWRAIHTLPLFDVQHRKLILPLLVLSLLAVPPLLLFGGRSPLLNKAACLSMTSAPPPLTDSATVSYSCQTAKPSLPPSQNRSCLSLSISLTLSFIPVLSHALLSLSPTLLFLPPHLSVILQSRPAMQTSGDPPSRDRKWSWPVLDPECVFMEPAVLERTTAAQLMGVAIWKLSHARAKDKYDIWYFN